MASALPGKADAPPKAAAQAFFGVPTLIINAKDDGLSAFDNGAQAAGRIRRSKLVAIDRGGHLLLGGEGRIKEEIAAFEMSAT